MNMNDKMKNPASGWRFFLTDLLSLPFTLLDPDESAIIKAVKPWAKSIGIYLDSAGSSLSCFL